MPGDGDKNLGIKICVSVPATEREKYRKEEEVALLRSKRSRGFIDSYTPSGASHHGQEVHQLPPMAVVMEAVAHLD